MPPVDKTFRSGSCQPDRARGARIMDPVDWTQWAHEMRTPLTVLIGAAALVEEGGCERDQIQEFVSAIRQNADVLHSRMEAWLNVCRLQAGDVRVMPIPRNLRSCFDAVSEGLNATCRANGVALEMGQPLGNLWAQVDVAWLDLVLRQFLERGLHLPGGVTRCVFTLVEGADGCEAHLDCFSSTLEGRAFDDTAVQAIGDFSGIGLAFCKLVVERGHGGRLLPVEVDDDRVRYAFWVPRALDPGSKG